MSDHHGDAQEVKEILEVVADKIPALINQLRQALFSAEAGQELGKAVGSFYKELVANGIPEAEALEMAKSYVGSLHNVLQQANIRH